MEKRDQLQTNIKKREYEQEQKLERRQEESNPFSISRNALCPCGSGERYKNCCGKIE
jgi:preprotein translocase subunit SecA